MLERVIENWLANATERQYQIPFCQLLSAEGEKVIYVSSHGPLELGIDVLTLDQQGTPKAYQLKMGDIALGEWRTYYGEVAQLVESHPSTPALPLSSPSHIPFLVTNGTVKDTVLNAINHQNVSWTKRGYRALIPISKDELFRRFRAAHFEYFPQKIDDLNVFLELYTSDAAAPLDKPKFCTLIEKLLPLDDEKLSGLQVQRAAASVVLLATYLLQNRVAIRNYWACFEGWTVVGAAILALATKYEITESFWLYSFNLCDDQALRAIRDLATECKANNTGLTQGSPFSDASVFGSRVAILNGLLSALRLRQVLSQSMHDEWANFALDFVNRNWKKARFWGESAMPFAVITALAVESNGNQGLGESYLLGLLDALCVLNKKGAGGVPNVYWSPEKCLRRSLGLDPQGAEEFEQYSYTAESLVHLLTRRLRKVAMRVRWFPLSHLNYATTIIEVPYEWLLWHAPSSSLDTRLPEQPQNWLDLLWLSENLPEATFPSALKQRPEFLVFFLLVYPHRMQPISVKVLDKSLRTA